jgi:hypothetical protein
LKAFTGNKKEIASVLVKEGSGEALKKKGMISRPSLYFK